MPLIPKEKDSWEFSEVTPSVLEEYSSKPLWLAFIHTPVILQCPLFSSVPVRLTHVDHLAYVGFSLWEALPTDAGWEARKVGAFLPAPSWIWLCVCNSWVSRDRGRDQASSWERCPQDSKPTLTASCHISWALPATQTGLLLPHSVPGPWPTWVAALGFHCLSTSCGLSSTSLGLCFPWPSLRKQLTNLLIIHSLLHSSSQHPPSPGFCKEQVVTKMKTPLLTSFSLIRRLPSPPPQDVS